MDSYIVSHVIGKGSYGKVYLASQNNKQYALKVCEKYTSIYSVCVGAVRECIFYNSMIPSPYLVKFRNQWITENSVYTLLDLYDCNMYEILHKEIHYNDFCKLAKNLILGVHHMHRSGWLHRDIKPDNIYVNASGDVVLGDFNLVYFKGYDEEIPEKRTVSSTNVCTLWTRAPELVEAGIHKLKYLNVGEETDVFSTCATLLSIAHGDYPFGKGAKKGEYEDVYLKDIAQYFNGTKKIHDLLPLGWTRLQRENVENLLTEGLQPNPLKRCTLKRLLEFSNEIHVDKWTWQVEYLIINASSKARKDCKKFNYIRILEPVKELKVNNVDTFWKYCSTNGVPSYIAIMACYLAWKYNLTCSYERVSILTILNIMHAYPHDKMAYDSLLIWPIAMRISLPFSLYKNILDLQGKPFQLCLLVAKISLGFPENLYVHPIEEFFGAYGKEWPSQMDMLKSWKRMDDTQSACSASCEPKES